MKEHTRKWRRDRLALLAACIAMIILSAGTMKLISVWISTDETWGENISEGSIFAINDPEDNGFPVLYQTDGRWRDAVYGGSCLGISGCAPTCMSMVIMGLSGDKSATPDKLAAYAEQNGYYVDGTGTSWEFMTEGGRAFGVTGEEISLNHKVMKKCLERGEPIICSMRPGDFTDEGHFIVLVGVENDKYIIHDPNSRERTRQRWDYKTLSTQIKNLWAFKKCR